MEENEAGRCPACGDPNGCGMAAGAERCWCFDEPRIGVPGDGARCLCRRCLARRTAERGAALADGPPSRD